MYLKNATQRFIFLLIVSFIFTVPGFAQEVRVGDKLVKTATWKGQEVKYAAQEIAVKLEPAIGKAQVTPLLQSFDAKLIDAFDKLGWGLVEVPPGEDIFTMISALEQSPLIAVAEPNLVTRTAQTPRPLLSGHQPRRLRAPLVARQHGAIATGRHCRC